MSKGLLSFKRSEVRRALRSAQEAGFQVKGLRFNKQGGFEVQIGGASSGPFGRYDRRVPPKPSRTAAQAAR